MSPLSWLVLVAALLVLVSLASGVASMARDGEVAHQTSAQWMVWRVVFQAAAFLLMVFAFFMS